jgi:hypothetical protein
MFDADKRTQIWLLVEKTNSLLQTTVKVLLPFVTKYLRETGFSAVAIMKKYLSRLMIGKELAVAISSMTPRFGW